GGGGGGKGGLRGGGRCPGAQPGGKRSQPGSAVTPLTDPPAAEPERPGEWLDFLAPPREPGELGWLARYRVVRLIGSGGMGLVFLAHDTDLDRPVALKVMRPEVARDHELGQRFLREARMTASVKNDHVITVHQVGRANG